MAKLGRASSHVRIQTAASKHFYVGRKIDGHSIDLLDSPGVGDQDVTPMAVLTLIERVIGKNNHGLNIVYLMMAPRLKIHQGSATAY